MCLRTTESMAKIWYHSKSVYASQWPRLRFGLRRRFCCCFSAVECCSHCGALCLFHILLCAALFPFSFRNHLDWEALLACLPGVLCFNAVPWIGLRCVVVVFSDHTPLLYYKIIIIGNLRMYMFVYSHLAQHITFYFWFIYLSNQ